MDNALEKLKELLGEKEDIHTDYYFQSKQLFESGLSFPIKLHLDNDTKENVLHSLFAIYRNHLQLISSDRHNKVIEDYLGKALIWENDILEISLIKEDKLIWKETLKCEELEESIRDHIIKVPQLMSFEGKEAVVILKLSESGFERKYNESVNFTSEQKMQWEINKIKEKLVFAHRESLSAEKEPNELSLRLIHRLKLWGYDFSESNYINPSFTEILKTQVHLNSLDFRHTWAIGQLHVLLMEPLSNEGILKEVNSRLSKEIEKLQSSYNYLAKFKTVK